MFYVSISTLVTYKDTSGHQGYGIIILNTYKLMLSHFCGFIVISKERFHDTSWKRECTCEVVFGVPKQPTDNAVVVQLVIGRGCIVGYTPFPFTDRGLRPGHPRERYKLYISLLQLSLYFPIRTPASGGFIASELWLKG